MASVCNCIRGCALLEYLKGKGITASVHFMPVYEFPYFQPMFPDVKQQLPYTEQLSKRVVSLPMFPDITEEQIDYVCEELTHFLKME